MRKAVRSFGLLPLFCVTKLLQPFLPKEHPWKGKNLSLSWWVEGATPLAAQISWSMWLGLAGLVLGYSLGPFWR